jgi:3-methyladenine DNA glycosylase AlkC
MSGAANPVPLKEMLNSARYRALADQLASLTQRFNRRVFLKLTLDELPERTLMDRIRQTSIAANASLPGTYRAKLRVLQRLAPRIEHNFVCIFLPDYVAQFGLTEIDLSLDALKFFTPFGSSEFGVRPFLAMDQKRVIKEMIRWAHDSDEHVRRLASEGCRPRLPWGQRLPELIRDPSPIAPILETLREDPSLYVRKSVANNLNDIAKDHPDWVLDRLESWDRENPHTNWIARRGVRTLVKNGHPRAPGSSARST